MQFLYIHACPNSGKTISAPNQHSSILTLCNYKLYIKMKFFHGLFALLTYQIITAARTDIQSSKPTPSSLYHKFKFKSTRKTIMARLQLPWAMEHYKTRYCKDRNSNILHMPQTAFRVMLHNSQA
jgi:hypothetical protein